MRSARILDRMVLLAGPLALAGFWLPWFEGRGLLTGNQYTGYDMLQFGAWLQDAGLGSSANLALEGARVLAVGIVIAALWLTLLSPFGRRNAFHRIAGVYLASASAILVAASVYWHGFSPLSPGIALIATSALLWLMPAAAARVPTRTGSHGPTHVTVDRSPVSPSA